jgi:zinc transporter, ZIP family
VTGNLAAVGLLVTGSLVAGAVAAAWLRLSSRVAALFTAFGGGLLLAAVALELLPEADRSAGRLWTALGLVGGAALYVGADAWLTRDQHVAAMRRSGHAAAAGQPMSMPAHSAEAARGETIAAGIVVDGVPESLALGLMAAAGEPGAALLVAVVLGNVTEAYGAAQPIVAGGHPRRFATGLLSGIGVGLGATAVLGGTLGADTSAAVVGTAQAVAAGAVLAVLSISIIPYTFEEVSSRVALATTLGVTAGYLLSQP